MEDEIKIEMGEIIWHPQYGFGIMKELPTFHNMQVAGIRKECISALSAMREAVQKGSIEFSKWKDDNCRDCGSGDEWTIGATGKIYTTEQLYQEYKKLNP